MKLACAVLAGAFLLAGCHLCSTVCGCPCYPEEAADGAGAAAGESLFDGKSLGKWEKIIFGGEGKIEVKDGLLVVNQGEDLSGVRWSGKDLPTSNYEFSLEAKKIEGIDFFCGIAFPVKKEHCSFVAGGWGGGVVGLSSVDGMMAAENETTTVKEFKDGQWYAIRLRVTDAKIETWIDQEKVIDLEITNRQISIHPAMDGATPLGIATYITTSAFRNIRLKRLPAK